MNSTIEIMAPPRIPAIIPANVPANMIINAIEAPMSTSMSKQRTLLIFNFASRNNMAQADAMPAMM
jgi:hypothetical protein